MGVGGVGGGRPKQHQQTTNKRPTKTTRTNQKRTKTGDLGSSLGGDWGGKLEVAQYAIASASRLPPTLVEALVKRFGLIVGWFGDQNWLLITSF